jgi:hypothetical protein
MAKLKEVEEGKRWEVGKYAVRHGQRYVPGSKVSEAVEAQGPDIYHVYFEEKYIAQASSLDDAKEAIIKHSKS